MRERDAYGHGLRHYSPANEFLLLAHTHKTAVFSLLLEAELLRQLHPSITGTLPAVARRFSIIPEPLHSYSSVSQDCTTFAVGSDAREHGSKVCDE